MLRSIHIPCAFVPHLERNTRQGNPKILQKQLTRKFAQQTWCLCSENRKKSFSGCLCIPGPKLLRGERRSSQLSAKAYGWQLLLRRRMTLSFLPDTLVTRRPRTKVECVRGGTGICHIAMYHRSRSAGTYKHTSGGLRCLSRRRLRCLLRFQVGVCST